MNTINLKKTTEALEALDKASKLLKEAGFSNAANTLDSIYEIINSDLNDALDIANDVKQEQMRCEGE